MPHFQDPQTGMVMGSLRKIGVMIFFPQSICTGHVSRKKNEKKNGGLIRQVYLIPHLPGEGC